MDQQHVTIGREDRDELTEFVLRINGERLGYLEYTRSPGGLMRIEYVEVVPELRGTGLGRQLVETAVRFAQEQQLTVVPICSYARMVIQRDPALGVATRERR